MNNFNIRVLVKEPRGFIRILEVLFGALAWSTTASFMTISTLHIDCPNTSPYTVEYRIEYPFDLTNTKVSSPANCTDDAFVIEDNFPIDFSSTSMLYVLICATSLLYALGSLVYYCLLTAKYETDPLAPMVDLCVTLLFTILWIIITCAWALNVSDLKHYTHPHYFKDALAVCRDTDANCQPSNPGKWSSLTVSIVCGFTCVLLWLGSTWYIFKETALHKKQYQTTTSGQSSQPVQQQSHSRQQQQQQPQSQ